MIIDTFREGPIGAVLFGGPSGVPMFVLFNLLTARIPRPRLRRSGARCSSPERVAPNRTAPRPTTPALLIDLGKGAPGVLLTIDPATKLLSSIDLKIAPRRSRLRNVSIEKLGWSSGAVSTEIAKDRSFAFEAPKGFAKVDTLLEQQAKPRE